MPARPGSDDRQSDLGTQLRTAARRLRERESAPLNVPNLIRGLGLELRIREGTGKVEGTFALVGGRPTVTLYRRAEGPLSRRETFTLAHELGHAVLHDLDPRTLIDQQRVHRVAAPSTTTPPGIYERLADEFAALVLVSDSDMELLGVTGLNDPVNALEVLDRLSRRCGVSAEVGAGRMCDAHVALGFCAVPTEWERTASAAGDPLTRLPSGSWARGPLTSRRSLATVAGMATQKGMRRRPRVVDLPPGFPVVAVSSIRGLAIYCSVAC